MKIQRAETLDDRIKAAGWFPGTEREWRALDSGDRAMVAFHGCGCAVAFPTWEKPVDCVHTGCLILRGELPKIAQTNYMLRAEAESGWLRWTPRQGLARLFKDYRRAARETGEYDIWKLSWQGLVGAAIGGLA